VIEMFDPLGKTDPELTAIALRKIEAEGVDIHAQTAVESVESTGKNIALHVKKDGESQTIVGSHLLVATGRSMNVEDLGLEAARIRLKGGAIRVNRSMKTSNRRVYAIGDVAGSLQFTHMAGYHAGLVVRNALFGLPVRENRDIIPWATYTDPEIAQVGLTGPQAEKRLKGNIKVIRVPFTQNDRARAERRTDGLVKMTTDRRGRIVGAGIVGSQAGELISFFAYAIANRMNVSSLTRFVAPYPTVAEILKRAGNAYYLDKLDNPWLARLRSFNRLLP
ncbi:MAG TPA: NAD(P)/FAD-dependent oxidoreductase, partial [Devosia sp.]|nr:NAD(P)/FAD-dependent oxidoreductase [Devosia sp.]